MFLVQGDWPRETHNPPLPRGGSFFSKKITIEFGYKKGIYRETDALWLYGFMALWLYGLANKLIRK